MSMYRPQAWRSRHRALSHEQAHSDESCAQFDVPLPEHPLVSQNEPELITTQAGLDALAAEVRAAGTMAYDSEFIGEQTYFPRLCLIQVATPTRVALVDALAELDLTVFWDLISDAAIEKVVHAGFQDLEPVVRYRQQPPRNVFDTQIAAAFTGWTYPLSLAKLVQACMNYELGKGPKFSHWDHRPLSAVQIKYAANDVRFLLAVRQCLGDRIRGTRAEPWANEELAALCDMDRYRSDARQQCMKMRGVELLRRRSRAILRELMIWRDQIAREHDIPPRSFLVDGVIMELARRPIKDVAELGRIRGLPRPIERDYGQAILEATQRGRVAPVDDFQSSQRRDDTPQEKQAIDALWESVQRIARENQVDPAIVTSRREVAAFFRKQLPDAPQGRLMNEPRNLLLGWRGQLLRPVFESLPTQEAPATEA